MTSNSDQPQEKAEDSTTAIPSEGTATAVPRARLTRLKINRFRNVKPGTELRFDDGINVLLGRNGTGKTTLLELMCSVASGNLDTYRHESFDLEFDIHIANHCFMVSAQNTISIVHTLAGLGPREQPQSWKYRVDLHGPLGKVATLEASPRAAKIRFEADGEDRTIDDGPLFGFVFYGSPFIDAWPTESLDIAAIAVTLFSIHGNCLRLDEGLDVFRSIVDGTNLHNHGLPVSVWVSSDEGLGQPAWYAPRALARYIRKQGPSLHEATEVAVDQTHFEVLNTVAHAIDVRTIRCSMMLLDRKQEAETKLIVSRFGKPSFWITTHRGTTFTHDQLSYGEKRFLTFMYHAAANPYILVADELVNGLHHGWIQTCLDAIQGQAFLTSQNPLLLDHLPFGSPEEVQRRFILCDRDEHGDWIWRNMDEDAADAFYRAYEVGLQHVSEILETKGLW